MTQSNTGSEESFADLIAAAGRELGALHSGCDGFVWHVGGRLATRLNTARSDTKVSPILPSNGRRVPDQARVSLRRGTIGRTGPTCSYTVDAV